MCKKRTVVSKFVDFHPLPGEMIQFEEHIFQMGWFNHQLEKKRCKRLPVTLVKGNPILGLPGCCPVPRQVWATRSLVSLVFVLVSCRVG